MGQNIREKIMDKNFKNFIDTTFLNDNFDFQKGRFTIHLPEVFGFCGGVISALKKLENTVEQCDESNIYLLGEIIHNPTVNEYFTQKGVNIIPENNIDQIYEVAGVADIIVIPAFGIPLSTEYRLRKAFHNIVDTTCKNVISVWDFISEQSEKGSTIILHGKPGHPEVKATVSRTDKNTSVVILPNIKAAEKFAYFLENGFPEEILKKKESIQYGIYWNINNFNMEDFTLANQTTMLYDDTQKIENIISDAIIKRNAKLSSCNTICRATYLRQKAAEKLCKKQPDLMFVVGGYDSSNTNHLYLLAKKHTKTIYIKDANAITQNTINCYLPEEDIEQKLKTKEIFKDCNSIGILAGASCPFSVINDLINKIGKI
jgi:4-hydroxy-3-methylbut-2-en-1-yl diphosphate reductase